MATKDQGEIDGMGAVVDLALKNGLNVAQTLWEMGYRKDPYPNGKGKPELIEIVETVQGQLAKARNLLRSEHEKRVLETFGISMDRHQELKPDCPVCKFLSDTSTVKS